MNLAQLRQLVEQTRDLPDNTVLVMEAESGTFEEVQTLRTKQVLAFQQPRSYCPLGRLFHLAGQDPAVFGFKSQAQLDERARVETVIEVG